MATDSPLAAAIEILRAADAGDWAAVSASVLPAAAEWYQRLVVEQARSDEDALRRGAPAWLVRPRVGMTGDSTTEIEAVYGVGTAAALERLPARKVVERAMRAAHLEDAAGPRRVLGEVREGADLAHVVFRRPDTASVDVLTVRRTPDGWQCGLGGGLLVDSGGTLRMSIPDDIPTRLPPREGTG